MIYGDDPRKINEKEDPSGRKTHTLVPDLTAIGQSGNLYVHCMNNPIRYVDPTGELVWPGQIHNAVSDYIIWMQFIQNGRVIKSNKYVKYKEGGFGLADLYDPISGEVWEIKPKSYYDSLWKRDRAEKQLKRYIDNIDGAMPGYSLIGKESFFFFSPGALLLFPSIYLVTFEYHSNGMIYYEYDEIIDPDKYAAVVAFWVTLLLLGLYFIPEHALGLA